MSESLDKLIDKVVSKKGLFKVPSWWVRRVLDSISEGIKKINDSIIDIKISLSKVKSDIITNKMDIGTLVYQDKYYSYVKCVDTLKSLSINDNGNYINFPVGNNREAQIRHTEMFDFLYISEKQNIVNINFLNSHIRRDFSFDGFSNLEGLSLPYNYASSIPECQYLFANCTKLKTIHIRRYGINSDMNLGTLLSPITIDANHMFYNCKSLTTLDLGYGAPVNVKDMSSMFEYCTNLASVKLPSLILPTKCVNINKMFYECKSLKVVPQMGVIFSGCNIEDFDSLFEGCTNLETETLSAGGFKVKSLYHTFTGCESLEEADLRQLNFEKINNLTCTFERCKSLKKILFPIKTINVNSNKIFHRTFIGCNSLTKLDLSMFNCTYAQQLPSNCAELTTINFNKFKVEMSGSSINTLFYSCPKLTTITGELYGIAGNCRVESPLTADSAMVIINGLSDAISVNRQWYIEFRKSTYDQLTPEQIKVATDKGWNVQYIEETTTTEEA